jgi:hypothetical protein
MAGEGDGHADSRWLLVVPAIAGCTEPVNKPGKKYLFKTDRCTDAGPADSAEYKACQKKQAEEDARRVYNLKQSGDTVPGWQPATSTPSVESQPRGRSSRLSGGGREPAATVAH